MVDLDDVTVERVVEFGGPIRTVAEILPETPAEFWRTHEELFVPEYWDPGTGAYLAHVQTWILRRGGLTMSQLRSRGVRSASRERLKPSPPAL